MVTATATPTSISPMVATTAAKSTALYIAPTITHTDLTDIAHIQDMVHMEEVIVLHMAAVIRMVDIDRAAAMAMASAEGLGARIHSVHAGCLL